MTLRAHLTPRKREVSTDDPVIILRQMSGITVPTSTLAARLRRAALAAVPAPAAHARRPEPFPRGERDGEGRQETRLQDREGPERCCRQQERLRRQGLAPVASGPGGRASPVLSPRVASGAGQGFAPPGTPFIAAIEPPRRAGVAAPDQVSNGVKAGVHALPCPAALPQKRKCQA